METTDNLRSTSQREEEQRTGPSILGAAEIYQRTPRRPLVIEEDIQLPASNRQLPGRQGRSIQIEPTPYEGAEITEEEDSDLQISRLRRTTDEEQPQRVGKRSRLSPVAPAIPDKGRGVGGARGNLKFFLPPVRKLMQKPVVRGLDQHYRTNAETAIGDIAIPGVVSQHCMFSILLIQTDGIHPQVCPTLRGSDSAFPQSRPSNASQSDEREQSTGEHMAIEGMPMQILLSPPRF